MTCWRSEISISGTELSRSTTLTATSQHLFTADELAALPHQGMRLELVRGEIRAMPPAFGWHGRTAMRLGIILGQYVLAQSLGET
jgi:Uma2 family endonuclease